MNIKFSLLFLLIFFYLSTFSQDFSKYNYFLKNRILSESIDLNTPWDSQKNKSGLIKVLLSQKEEDEILLKNYLFTPNKSIDTLNNHFVYYKSVNEKSKVLFGQKFDNLFFELDLSNSIAFEDKPSGHIKINFHKKFKNKEESKNFYFKIMNLVENITNQKFKNVDWDSKFKEINWKSLITNENNISLFNYGNNILLCFEYFFVEDSWPSEARFDEFSENFRLFDKLTFFNGFRFKNSIVNYLNVLSPIKTKDAYDYNIYEITSQRYRNNIAEIQFDNGYIFEQDKKIFKQIYLINKKEYNNINSDYYQYYIKNLIKEFGYGCFNPGSDEVKKYYWRGNNVMITFEYNIVEQYYRLIVDAFQ